VITFGFKGILDDYGLQMEEIAMDSTCENQSTLHSVWSLILRLKFCVGRTNALGYELFALVGEANGQAVPFAFIFTTSTDGTAASGVKDRMLHDLLNYVVKRCPNTKFTLSDKDPSKVSTFHHMIMHAKHQLCCWHGNEYVKESLVENTPPAMYDLHKAHAVFSFI